MRFRERRITDHRTIARDLQVNAWILAYPRLAGEMVYAWHGPDDSQIEIPRKRGRNRSERIGLADVRLDGYLQLGGLRRKELAPVAPDATLYMQSASGRRFQLLIELDRTRRPTKNQSTLLRYDALLSAWWRAVTVLRAFGEPPAVIFICQDDHDRDELMHLADGQVTGCLQNPGDPPERWRYPGRERMLFVAERDIHEGNVAAKMLTRQPTTAAHGGPSSRASTCHSLRRNQSARDPTATHPEVERSQRPHRRSSGKAASAGE